MNEIINRAAEQDANRQEQIKNQKEAIDRLLDKTNALQSTLTQIQAVVTEAVAAGNNSSYIDRISDITTDELLDELNG